MSKSLWVIVFVAILVFTRFYNLENTTRFIWDESSDLVRLHQIYVDHKLTLVGPISEDNFKVFGSLAYYLSLPFAVQGQFDPISPVIGTVVGGLITAISLILLSLRLNKKLILLVAVVILGWFPLLQSSRASLWAWHVSYIPMWMTLGLLLYIKGDKLSLLLSGVFLGLTIHHHYLSVFAVGSFSLVAAVAFIQQRQFHKVILLGLGLGIALLPFVLFDLRHPPGLFLTRILYGSPIETQLTLGSFVTKLGYLFTSTIEFFAQFNSLAVLLTVLTPLLLLHDLWHKNKSLLWASGWIGQLVGLLFIYNDGVSIHYTLPAAVFFLLWLISPRQQLGKLITISILSCLVVSSLLSIPKQLTTKTWQTDIPTVRHITKTIDSEIKTRQLDNVNLAVLASADNNIYGRRYRDVLLVREIRLRTKDEYQFTDNLFVVSTQSEEVLRNDQAYEMHFFRNGSLVNSWSWSDSEWKLYLFNRNPR